MDSLKIIGESGNLFDLNSISGFAGDYRWLSNFWPCNVEFENLSFRSVEFGYVAAKTTCLTLRQQIQQLETSGQAKRFGRTIQVREDWMAIRLSVMESLLRQKFSRGSELAIELVSTGDLLLVETNTWGDTFWGVCNGIGSNNLGRLIMTIRSDLQS